MRRGLGYRSRVQERALRAFARHLDGAGHRGPIPLETSLDWASATTSPDPCNPARRLGMVGRPGRLGWAQRRDDDAQAVVLRPAH